MAESKNILVSTKNIRAFQGVHDRLMDAQIAFIDHKIPDYRIDGKLFCFLDPGKDILEGLELCRKLRSSIITSHGFITFTVEQDGPEIRKVVAAAGADDLQVGTLSPELLMARIEELETFYPTAGIGPELTLGELKIDPIACKVTFRNKFIKLTALQLSILSCLARNCDRVVPKRRLMDTCRENADPILEKSFDISVCKLKQALGRQGVPNALRTVRARGYVLDSDLLTGKRVLQAAWH